jgi:hypothetical protein
MSWDIFKSKVGSKMQDAKWSTTQEFASFFTKAYDECMKRGVDTSSKNRIKKGNTETMEALLNVAAATALVAKTPAFYSTYLQLVGNAVIGYWTGATLDTSSIPLIPALGTILNLKTVSNSVTNPGKWVPLPTPPVKDVDIFLSSFISCAKIHLTTVGGSHDLISQYIPPLPIGPAIMTWTGYKIEPEKKKPKGVAPVVQINEPVAVDDPPPVERVEFVEHNRRNGKVTFNYEEDKVDKKVEPKSSFYSKPANTKPTPKTTTKVEVQSTNPVYPNVVGAGVTNTGPVGGTGSTMPASLKAYKNGFIDAKKLVPIADGSGKARYQGGKYLLEAEAANQFLKWKAAVNAAGVKFSVTSAYRDYEHQSGLKAKAGSSATVAGAGGSMHGLGIAIDISELFQLVGGSGVPSKNTAAKKNSKLYQFLAKTGPNFGWYNPYRLADGAGSVDELWHWEYWGYGKQLSNKV